MYWLCFCTVGFDDAQMLVEVVKPTSYSQLSHCCSSPMTRDAVNLR